MLHRWLCCLCLLCRNDLVWRIYITMGLLYKRLKVFHPILKSKRLLTRFCLGPGSAFPLRIILDIFNLFSVSLENSREWLVLCSVKISANGAGCPPSLVQDQNKNNLPDSLWWRHSWKSCSGWLKTDFSFWFWKWGLPVFAFAIGGVCLPGAWLEKREKEQGEVNREVNG